jgi:transcriptional regulator with XRE-family HTH domain
MVARNPLLSAPPYQVEQALKTLGANLRTARLRRNLTLQEVAEKIGVERHAVAAAEKGKPSTGMAVYAAHLWVLGLVDQLGEVAAPERDDEGTILARAQERSRARQPTERDDDF